MFGCLVWRDQFKSPIDGFWPPAAARMEIARELTLSTRSAVNGGSQAFSLPYKRTRSTAAMFSSPSRYPATSKHCRRSLSQDHTGGTTETISYRVRSIASSTPDQRAPEGRCRCPPSRQRAGEAKCLFDPIHNSGHRSGQVELVLRSRRATTSRASSREQMAPPPPTHSFPSGRSNTA